MIMVRYLSLIFLGQDAKGLGYYSNAGVYNNGSQLATYATFASGQLACVAIDLGNRKAWWRLGTGGNWNNDVIGNQNPATNTGGQTVPAGTIYPAVCIAHYTDINTAAFASASWSGTAPAGFGPFDSTGTTYNVSISELARSIVDVSRRWVQGVSGILSPARPGIVTRRPLIAHGREIERRRCMRYWQIAAICSLIASGCFVTVAQAGTCGSANGVATTTPPTSNLCSSGSASALTQSGSNWVWTCTGHGPPAHCSAPIPSPSPSLTLTITPPSPLIPDTSPIGTVVATVTAAWSDGSQFTGTIGFVGPYYDDGGTFALSGNQLIVSPMGMGVNGDAGTVQDVSIEATQ